MTEKAAGTLAGAIMDAQKAALRQAYREGVEALRDAAISDWSPGTVYSRETARTWLEGVAARVGGGGPHE